MASLIRYVNRSVVHTSGDGTTDGTGNGGTNSFNTLNDAEVALRQTLTGVTCDVADENGDLTIALDILCTGGTTDTTLVAFADAAWVTDATHRVRVRLNGTGAGAKWDTLLYILSAAPGYGVGTLKVNKAIHVTFQDLQVEATGTLDLAQRALMANSFAWDIHVVRGFYRTTGTTGTYDSTGAIRFDVLAGVVFTLYMQNVTGVSADGFGCMAGEYNNAAHTAICYNCTFVNRSVTNRFVHNAVNLDTGGTQRFKNLLLQGATGANLNYFVGTPDEAVTILTQDASAPGTGLDSLVVSFVDSANWDYHLASGDTAAKGAGTDLSADAAYDFTTDGDGATRSGTWDIGADEVYVAPAGPILMAGGFA